MFSLFGHKTKDLSEKQFAATPIHLKENNNNNNSNNNSNETSSIDNEDNIVGNNTDHNDGPSSSSSIDPEIPTTTTTITTLPPSKDTDGDDANRPTNEYVLNVAFFSFLGFMVFQAIFAMIANSKAMLADCEAMSVDALTYLFNLVAERVKNRPYSPQELRLPKPQRLRNREMTRLYLELIPPLISVTTLIAVTIYVINDSIKTLYGQRNDDNGDGDDDDDVNVNIMLLFSALNLLLDIVNVTCFARADQAFGVNNFVHSLDTGYHVTEHLPIELEQQQQQHRREKTTKATSTEKTPLVNSNKNNDHGTTMTMGGDGQGAMNHRTPSSSSLSRPPPPHNFFAGINLNMCSAWTHVCADTMRSVAVLIAAGIATAFQQIQSGDADAWAAIVVSLIILGSLLPLLHGLFITTKEILLFSRTSSE